MSSGHSSSSFTSLDIYNSSSHLDFLSTSNQSEILSSDELRSITAALSRNQEDVALGAVQFLNKIMQKNRVLRSILSRQDPPIILQRLAQLMSKHPITPQLLYEILLCFWLLTFQTTTASLFRFEFK